MDFLERLRLKKKKKNQKNDFKQNKQKSWP
jgi:hypothetical protein